MQVDKLCDKTALDMTDMPFQNSHNVQCSARYVSTPVTPHHYGMYRDKSKLYTMCQLLRLIVPDMNCPPMIR